MEIAEHDAEVGDGFFDSEDDDETVDMALVYEAMKHVPLPDFDYAERAVAAPSSAAVTAEAPHVPSSATTKAPKDAALGKKKGAGRARPLKRMKPVGSVASTEEKSISKTIVKGGGNRIAAAAKVAAKVAPNVVTGGAVAEAGPRPDFSLWTVEDDLLLENAMEAGAAVEALAKGAMRFSHRFTVRELRERWRALLYDPELSAEASARMVEAEAALSDLPRKNNGPRLRHLKQLEQKRRSNSIRSLYHKRRRSLAEGKRISAIESQTPEEGATGEKREEVKEKLVDPLSTTPLGNVDPGLLEGLLSPKGSATDFDNTFTQMVSLLAAGGVGAVFGALPGNSNADIVEDQEREQENQRDEVVSEVVVAAPKIDDVVMEQSVSNDELNLSGQLNPIEQGVMQLPSFPLDREKSIEEGEGVPEVFNDKKFIRSEGFKGAANIVGNSESDRKDSGCRIAPAEATTAAPVTQKSLVCLPESLLLSPGSGTADIEVARRPEHKTQETFGSVSLDANPSVVHTEQSSHMQSVKAETVPDAAAIGSTLGAASVQHPPVLHTEHLKVEQSVKVEKEVGEAADVGLTLGVGILRRPSVLEESHEVGGEGDIDTHEVLKQGVLNSSTDPGQEQDFENEPDQEHYLGTDQDEDLESDQDFESERRLSYTESDYDGDYFESEGLDIRAEDELLYASGSPDTLLDHDLAMLDLEPSEHVQVEPIDEIMIDPIFGPIVCARSAEDTEIPNLFDVLPLPVAETALNYYSDGGLRDAYLLECNSPDDEADVPSSPSEFHVYEDWESSDAMRDQIHAPKSGDDNVWGPEKSAGKQVCAFPQSSPQSLLAENLSPSSFGGRPAKDEAVSMSDVDGEAQLIQFPALQLQPSDCDGEAQRASADPAGKPFSNVQHSQWQPVPAEVDPVLYHGDMDSLTGREDLVREDPETGVLRSDEEASALEIAEEELESDGDTRFSDVEAMMMNMDLDPGVDDEFSALEESRRMYSRQRRMLVRLEQNFSSAMQRSLTKRKALALLYGRNLLYYMTKPEVLVGRMTQDNIVDIDLGKEGRANKVSRQQASLKLKDGLFYLQNLGRRSLTVNNIAVDTDQRAILGSNCLIEVGGMCFIFEINKKLVKQQMERKHHDS